MSKQEQIRISPLQLSGALIITRMLINYLSNENGCGVYGMQRFSVVVLSAVIIFLMFVPLMWFSYKYPGKNFFDVLVGEKAARKKHQWVIGWVIFVVIVILLSSNASYSIMEYTMIMTSTNMKYMKSIIISTMGAACIAYTLLRGVRAVVKLGVFFSVMLTIFLILEYVLTLPLQNIGYLYPRLIDDTTTFWSEVKSEVLQSTEIVIFGFLSKYCIERETKVTEGINKKGLLTVPFYLGVTTILSLFMHFLNMVISGSYLLSVSFPTYSVSLLADALIIERLDDIDAFIWTGAMVVKLCLIFIVIETMLITITEDKKLSRYSAAVFSVFLHGLVYFLDVKQIFINYSNDFMAIGFALSVVFSIILASRKRENIDVMKEAEA